MFPLWRLRCGSPVGSNLETLWATVHLQPVLRDVRHPIWGTVLMDCQSVWLLMVVDRFENLQTAVTFHFPVCILISAPKNDSFQFHPHNLLTEKTKLVINFPHVVQQHYIGEGGKSITFLLLITSAYFVPNIAELGQHM